MAVLNTTPNRGYQEPYLGNPLSTDVGRIISALRAIDTDVADALTLIVAKAGLVSPAFTGVPTAPTASPGADTSQIATTAFVRAAVLALINSSPGALDTLNELAAALGDDPNFAATTAALIGAKADAAATTAALALKQNTAGEYLRGHLYGLTLSNNVADAANDIDIAVGSAASDGTTPAIMVLASALGKRLDAAWAVGGTPASPVGGLDTGSVANATYHVWLIQRSDTGVVDALFSLSSTSPTMPSGYDRKRRIGSIVRVSSAIKAFSQNADEFLWLTPASDASSVTVGTDSLLVALTVPSGIKVNAIFNSGMVSNTVGTVLLVTSPDQTAVAVGSIVGDATHYTHVASAAAIAALSVRTNTSGQIRLVSNATAETCTFSIATRGFFDTRGRI